MRSITYDEWLDSVAKDIAEAKAKGQHEKARILELHAKAKVRKMLEANRK